MTKKRILFVDDQPEALQALQRTFRPMRNEWETEFSASARQALQKLDSQPFDVIVSDMRMPQMDGAELLKEVRRRYPGVVRIILSGCLNPDSALQSVATAHQYLAKPCDIGKLKETIRRTCRLQDLLGSQALLRLVAGLESLPSLPGLYHKIVRQLESPHADVRKIGETVETDLGMAAKVLQLVNSAYFGLPRQIQSVVDAVVLLGIETVKALVLSCQVFSQFDAKQMQGIPVHQVWSHSMASAGLARRIARQAKLPGRQLDQVFLAGLLHDVGKLILAANDPDGYREILRTAQREEVAVWKLEKEAWGASHAQVGGYLLGLWGLPEPLVEAVAFHHQPADARPDNRTVLAVHVADALNHQQQSSDLSGSVEFDMDYLQGQGQAGSLAAWAELRDEMGS